jgi:cytochrome c oxidase subunit 4
VSGEVHHHPGWSTYWKVALILTLITVGEVWAYYMIMSALKFAIVVMFYMHLKYDHKLFRVLFTGPLFVAAVTLISLLFLFGQLVARFGPQ